jgi:hypothetical protein
LKGVHPVKNVHFSLIQAHPVILGQSVYENTSQYWGYVIIVVEGLGLLAHKLVVEFQVHFADSVQSALDWSWLQVHGVREWVWAAIVQTKIAIIIYLFIISQSLGFSNS